MMLTIFAIIAAVSLNLVNGFTGQFSLGHAGFVAIGAYVGGSFTVFFQKALFGHILGLSESPSWLQGSLVLIAAMLVGGGAAALAGFLVGLPSLKLRGDYLAIVTLGFNQIVIVIIQNLDIVGGAAGFTGYHSNTDFVPIPMLTSFFWAALVAVGVIVFSINLRKSVHGLAFESIREDEIAAEAMGIPTTRYKVTAFVLGAFIAGVAGVLFVHYNQGVAPPNVDFVMSINYVVMVVLGGLGSVSGSVLGAIVLTVLPEALRGEFQQYRLVLYSILLVILMLVRPQGAFGRDEFGREWLIKQYNGLLSLPARIVDWGASLIRKITQRRSAA
jgi:branched-chain amino acid transport system permease protein